MRKLAAAVGAGLLVATGSLFWLAIPNSVIAAEVSGPFVSDVTTANVPRGQWHTFATFTATENVWAESSATLAIHNASVGDRITIRASVNGVFTYLGDWEMRNVQWTVGAATRQYELNDDDVMTYQVRVTRNTNTGSVTVQNGQAWWTTIPRSVPSPTPTATTQEPTATPPTTPPPGSGFPNYASTGHSGTLTPTSDCNVEANTTVENAEFNCTTLTVNAGSTVRNSQVNGEVKFGSGSTSATIEDSTLVGNGACDGRSGLGNERVTARRVHILNFADGIRSEGPDVKVFDSLIELCASGHDDGIQICPQPHCEDANPTTGVEFIHNTVNMCKCDSTGTIFVMGNSASGGVYNNNLLMGGSFTVRIHSAGQTFTGNRIVQDSGLFGEITVDNCTTSYITWSDNKYVTMDGPPPPANVQAPLPYAPNYTVASTGADANCQA